MQAAVSVSRWQVGTQARLWLAGVAHVPRPLLKADVNTAARGIFEHLFGLVGEVVAPKTVNKEQSG